MEATLSASNVSSVTSAVTAVTEATEYDVWTWYGATLVLLPILMAIGLPGNVLILIVYTCRFPPSTFREFVRVLGLLDLACNLVGMPLVFAHALLTQQVSNKHLLQVAASARYASYLTIFSSGYVLVVIACDRYVKICHPQRRGINVRMARILSLVGIVVAVLINVPTFFIDFESDGADNMAILHTALTGLSFLLITVSMVTLYALVWRRLRAHARQLRKSSTGVETLSAPDSAARNAVRTSKIFSAVTVLFFLSILPHFLLFIATTVDATIWPNLTPVSSVFVDLANLSPFVNCVANPFVYSLTSPRFRKESLRLLRGLRHGHLLSKRATMSTTSSGHQKAGTGRWASRDTSEDRLDASVRMTAVRRIQIEEASSSSSSLAASQETMPLDDR